MAKKSAKALTPAQKRKAFKLAKQLEQLNERLQLQIRRHRKTLEGLRFSGKG